MTKDKDETSVSSTNKKKESDAKPPSTLQLLSLAKPEFGGIFIAMVFMVLSEASTLIQPLILADAYDTVIDSTIDSSAKMAKVNRIVIIVLIIHFGGMLGQFLRSILLTAAGERVVARLRIQLYRKILKQDITFFDETNSGELASRLGSDTTLVQQATTRSIPEVILVVVKMIVCIVLMFWISPSLAGLALALTSVVFAVSAPFGKWLSDYSKRYQNALGEAQSKSTEALGAIRTVQSFASEEREINRYSDYVGDPSMFPVWWPSKKYRKPDPNGRVFSGDSTYKVGVYKGVVNSGFFTFVFGGGFGALNITLWYGFKLVIDGHITLGALTAFNSYVFQIGMGLGQSSAAIAQAIEAKGASTRIFELMSRVPSIPTPIDEDADLETKEGKKKKGHMNANSSNDLELGQTNSQFVSNKPELTGELELSNVSFSYPSRPNLPVLRNVNLTIPTNTTAAFVGSSGAGKSTIVSLLQRFYDVSDGKIKIDGHDIRELDLKYLRQQIGYVQQEPQLFGLSIRENVCYGVERDVLDDELETVCREANAHDFISKWPDKYETLVGERGVKLSGGQKQRLAIARALLVNPRILLLDEATSALDSESEHLVQEAINKAVVGRTVVIVAHRLSTIRNSEQIVVLDDHEIVDVGRHEELLGRCQKYQELIKRQTQGQTE